MPLSDRIAQEVAAPVKIVSQMTSTVFYPEEVAAAGVVVEVVVAHRFTTAMDLPSIQNASTGKRAKKEKSVFAANGSRTVVLHMPCTSFAQALGTRSFHFRRYQVHAS